MFNPGRDDSHTFFSKIVFMIIRSGLNIFDIFLLYDLPNNQNSKRITGSGSELSMILKMYDSAVNWNDRIHPTCLMTKKADLISFSQDIASASGRDGLQKRVGAP